MAELLALARSKPGYINYTSSGIGTIAHLTSSSSVRRPALS